MPLLPGTRVGAHEVLALIGSGGMGEVYRARDTTLNRDVAIKVLPDSFAADPDRLARFQREAQVLATLNHPHIAHIYGFDQTGGLRALVMELVEGEDLAQRIARGPIPIDEALPIAKQIADALEAAHEQGIIHRDLKPANIKVRLDGTVKVLDFGLAKAMDPVSTASNVSQSPTITTPAMTQAGMILGTAAYMSPEQARGTPVDKRADLWAFGVVLWEMLTGTRLFEGATVSDTLAAVLKTEPAWTALAPETPSAIRRLLRRCLEKDRRRRLPDAADARLEIEEALTAPAAGTSEPAAAPSPRAAAVPIALALAGGALIASLVTWILMRSAPQAPGLTSRFAIALPQPAQALTLRDIDRDIAISPDGTRLVYTDAIYIDSAGGQTPLMVRAIDQLDAVRLDGTADAHAPFISPDGRWVGFFTGGDAGGELKKVSIDGGPAISLCKISRTSKGASWGPDDTIIFATNEVDTGLLSVPAGGGEPKALTKPDRAHGERDHYFPSVLPGGRGVLFTIRRDRAGATAAESGSSGDDEVAVLDLSTGQYKTLIREGSHAEYVETGHLVYAAAGTLRAARFDLARLEVLSDPVPVVGRVMTRNDVATNFGVSRHGTLVYRPGDAGSQSGAARSLVWVDRQGREEAIHAPLRAYVHPSLSPDGSRVAVSIGDQERDIWIWDLARQALTRFTVDPSADTSPLWTPDGQRLLFASSRGGAPNLFWQRGDGSGPVERLTTSPNQQVPASVSPDGKSVFFMEISPRTSGDVMRVSLDSAVAGNGAGVSRTEPILQTPFAERIPVISPDGRWLAFESNESGQYEIYVRPFPNVDAGRWQISNGGGSRPVWAHNGRELFFLVAGSLMSVTIQTTPVFSAGHPMKLFDGPYFRGVAGRTYDISGDDQRFLMIKDNAATDQTPTPASIVVVLNWFEELKAKVPAGR